MGVNFGGMCTNDINGQVPSFLKRIPHLPGYVWSFVIFVILFYNLFIFTALTVSAAFHYAHKNPYISFTRRVTYAV